MNFWTIKKDDGDCYICKALCDGVPKYSAYRGYERVGVYLTLDDAKAALL